MNPTADKIRPTSLDDMVGQPHLFGSGGLIRKMLERGYYTNMIFYGPPGTGKTTAANIIAEQSGMALYRLNATSASLNDVKDIINQAKSVFSSNGTLLYLDEIQYFNKKQQQSLLEYMENGKITLIASTTENPYLYVYNAIISRSALFEFFAVSSEEIKKALNRALEVLNREYSKDIKIEPKALDYISICAAGDVRRGVNTLENLFFVCDGNITEGTARELLPGNVGNFDASGTVHYDLLSALQKSIRGSDPDAAIFYLAKILEGGDLIGAVRRLQVIASEDVALAYPLAPVITKACCDSAISVGLPEASLPLSNCVIMLATAPKSNSAHIAYEAAREDVITGRGQLIPDYMRPSNSYSGYKYPHDFPDHYVKQQYLPADLADAHYYDYGPNKTEQTAKAYWEKIKNK